MMDMREPFIRVAHYVYVNNFKFTKIKRIQRISNWHSHQKHSEEAQNALQEEINRTARPFEGEKEEEEHFHLRSMLWYITDLVTNSNQTANQLPILLTVLNLLFITI